MLKILRNFDRTVGLPVLRYSVEQAILGPWSVPHRLLSATLSVRLRLIDSFVDQPFYLRQLTSQKSRRAAQRDPVLHYHLVGRFHNLAPSPDFDPIAYREENPHLSWVDDPLLDFVSRGDRRMGICVSASDGQVSTRGTVLTIHHGRGGGSGHYLDLYEQHLKEEGYRVVRLARVSLGAPLFRAIETRSGAPLSPVFGPISEQDVFVALIRSLGAVRLAVNHAVDLPVGALSAIPEAARRAGIPFDVHLHDYFYLCPLINLVDEAGHYCDAAETESCKGCGSRQSGITVPRSIWRAEARRFLASAETVFGPSLDVAARYARHWPEIEVTVRPPEDDADIIAPLRPTLKPGEPLTVAILGRLNVAKGFDVVLNLAKCIRRRAAPVRLVLIGQSIDDASLRRQGVVVHGRYRAAEATPLLQRYAPHLVFLPSIWPETWSFVLSLVLRARLPVCAFDIGAVAERLRALRLGTVLPYALTAEPEQLLAHLIATGRNVTEAPAIRLAQVQPSL